MKDFKHVICDTLFESLNEISYKECDGCPCIKECEDNGNSTTPKYCWKIIKKAILTN